MKVLITGGSGLLGKYLSITKPDKVDIDLTWYSNRVSLIFPDQPSYHLDITNKANVRYVIARSNPDAIIHCAAQGSVDYAEQNYQDAWQTNVKGLSNIAWAANGVRVIFISSNAVYGGNTPPYNEDSIQSPVNLYGRIKRDAERELKGYNNWLIIRPFMFYGWPYPGGRDNWATIIVNRLRDGKRIQLVDDTIWMPTYIGDCAIAIWKLLEIESNQSFNVASNSKMTLYEFGLAIANIFNLDKNLIRPVPSSYFKTIAARPVDTSYDLSKIKSLGIELDSVEDGLDRMKNE